MPIISNKMLTLLFHYFRQYLNSLSVGWGNKTPSLPLPFSTPSSPALSTTPELLSYQYLEQLYLQPP